MSERHLPIYMNKERIPIPSNESEKSRCDQKFDYKQEGEEIMSKPVPTPPDSDTKQPDEQDPPAAWWVQN
jgi:hypothetical protein